MPGTAVRITGGSARGLPLAIPKGLRLRPTSGQVREAVFNILDDTVSGARVLDLFAGTGALGMEALSRGAAEATFVDGDPASVEAILKSLHRADFATRGRVRRGKLPAALEAIDGPFDLVFLDPPYQDPVAAEVLVRIAPLLASAGVVVYEHSSRYNPPDRPLGLRMTDRRTYGDTAVAFYAPEEE